jgi:hypothetical protein
MVKPNHVRRFPCCECNYARKGCASLLSWANIWGVPFSKIVSCSSLPFQLLHFLEKCQFRLGNKIEKKWRGETDLPKGVAVWAQGVCPWFRVAHSISALPAQSVLTTARHIPLERKRLQRKPACDARRTHATPILTNAGILSHLPSIKGLYGWPPPSQDHSSQPSNTNSSLLLRVPARHGILGPYRDR